MRGRGRAESVEEEEQRGEEHNGAELVWRCHFKGHLQPQRRHPQRYLYAHLRTNDWVVRRFRQMGYAHDVDAENTLRHAVKDIHWFRDTVMVFRRRGGARGARNRRTREQMAPDT